MEAVASFFGITLLGLGLLVGVLIIPFGLPGTFVIAGLALVHGLMTSFAPLTAGFVGIIFLLAGVGEAVEFFLGAATAKKYGGSKRAMWGAIAGGFIGAIFGTGVLPVFGTIMGALIGAFGGAALAEYSVREDLDNAIKVGFGAFIGALGGKLMKITLSIVMAAMIMHRVIAA